MVANFMSSSFLGSLAIFLASHPSRIEVAGSLVCGLLLSVGLGLRGPGWQMAMMSLCYWGMGAFLTKLISLHKGRSTDIGTLGEMAIAPSLVFLTGLFVGTLRTGTTYDYFLYAFDWTLGCQPGFWAAALIISHPWLGALSACAYVNLPLAVMLLYLYYRRVGSSFAGLLLRFCILIGLCGYFCYQVLPAVGGMFVFPSQFPDSPPPPSEVQLVRADVRTEAIRNCMPSLHTSWGLALWWLSRGVPGALRRSLAVYLVFMLFHTLGLHYLVDMIVAFPFTLAIYPLLRPLAEWRRTVVWMTCCCGALLSAAWLLMLRFSIPFFYTSPVIPWGAIVGTVLACQWLRLRLEWDMDSVLPRLENLRTVTF